MQPAGENQEADVEFYYYAALHWLNLINVLWIFTICIRATDLFSIMDQTRQLFSIVKVSVRDVVPFMIITIYILYVFGAIKQFQALINGDESMTLLEQTGTALSETLGGFDTPEVGDDKVVGAWLIFIMLQIVTNIIVLNTLIAILGDTYDNVMTE